MKSRIVVRRAKKSKVVANVEILPTSFGTKLDSRQKVTGLTASKLINRGRSSCVATSEDRDAVADSIWATVDSSAHPSHEPKERYATDEKAQPCEAGVSEQEQENRRNVEKGGGKSSLAPKRHCSRNPQNERTHDPANRNRSGADTMA